MKQALSFILGFFFALGLGISQMTRPPKILAFLDILGNWDPSLLVVMGGAVASYFVLQKLIRRNFFPRFSPAYTLPKEAAVDRRLLIGAALFGIGWGIGGLCPGPATTALASGKPQIAGFVIAMIAGINLFTWWDAHK